jgi:hypothetical protein
MEAWLLCMMLMGLLNSPDRFGTTKVRYSGVRARRKPGASNISPFRMHDGVDTSYTKFPTAAGKDAIDNNAYETVTPPKDQLYVGWTEPGEWFHITIEVAKAGKYRADLLYTSNRGGSISLDVNGQNATGPVMIPTKVRAGGY